jgi:hypothetical protein
MLEGFSMSITSIIAFIAVIYLVLKYYRTKTALQKEMQAFSNYRHDIKNELMLLEHEIYRLNTKKETPCTIQNIKNKIRTLCTKR